MEDQPYILDLLKRMDAKLDKVVDKVDEHSETIVRHETKIDMHHGMISELYAKVETISTNIGEHFVEDRMRIDAMEKKDQRDNEKGLTKYQIIFGGLGVGFFVVVIGALIERIWPK